MNQLVLGAAIPFLMLVMAYLLNRCRAGRAILIGGPLFMLLGSLWAVAPDLPRLWGNQALYDKLSRDPRMNVFFFHYTIDQTETNSPFWFVGAIVIIGFMLVVAWRELSLAEQGRR